MDLNGYEGLKLESWLLCSDSVSCEKDETRFFQICIVEARHKSEADVALLIVLWTDGA